MSTARILCASDFSDASKRAGQLAGQLALAFGGDVELLHAYEIPVMVLPEGVVSMSPDYLTAFTDKAQSTLDEQKRSLQTQGVPVTTQLRQGAPAQLIVEEAQKCGATMVVMGTHGRTGFKHLLMGSVAERVVRTASVPVLTVRESKSEGVADQPVGSIKKMVVAFDFSEPAGRALATAASLASKLDAELHLVHVHVDLYTDPQTPAAGVPWPTSDQTERYLRFLHEELSRAANGVLPGAAERLKVHVERGDPVRALLGCAERLQADLICVGSTGKGAVQRALLGSVTQSVLRTSPIPVLTVH